jgi:hypothetical protein
MDSTRWGWERMLQLQEVEDRKTPATTTWAAEFLLRGEESREFLGSWITSGAIHEAKKRRAKSAIDNIPAETVAHTLLLLQVRVREQAADRAQVEFVQFGEDAARAHEVVHLRHVLRARVVVRKVLELGKDVVQGPGLARCLYSARSILPLCDTSTSCAGCTPVHAQGSRRKKSRGDSKTKHACIKVAVFMNEVFRALCVVSGAFFVATSSVLLGGYCGRDNRNLEYISTQLAACLDTFPEASWVFVVTLQVQTFLLLNAWERLFRSTKLLLYFECVITTTAATFVICVASVVEFRSDRTATSAALPSVVESSLHGWAAVGAIVSFGGLHLLLAISLLDLSYCEQKMIGSPQVMDCLQEYKTVIQNYMRFDKGYFLCVLVFFIAWPISLKSGSGTFLVAATSEWMILIVSSCMHVYALLQITRPVPWVTDKSPAAARSACVKGSCLLSLLFSVTFTCTVFLFAPVSASAHTTELHTSVLFLLLVISSTPARDSCSCTTLSDNRAVFNKDTLSCARCHCSSAWRAAFCRATRPALCRPLQLAGSS